MKDSLLKDFQESAISRNDFKTIVGGDDPSSRSRSTNDACTSGDVGCCDHDTETQTDSYSF